MWYTHKNYTAKFQGNTNITADSILSTNSTLDLNDNPTMSDVLENTISNQSTTDTTTNSFARATFGIMVSVCVVIVIGVIVVVFFIRKSWRETSTNGTAQDQEMYLLKRES